MLTDIDVLIFCTGYQYDFPFLKSSDLVSTNPRGVVYPLYKDMMHPQFPTLSFISVSKEEMRHSYGWIAGILGLQRKSVPFFVAQIQSQVVARVWSGRCHLPNSDVMMAEIDRSLESYKRRGKPMEYVMVLHQKRICESHCVGNTYVSKISLRTSMKSPLSVMIWIPFPSGEDRCYKCSNATRPPTETAIEIKR